MPRLVLENANLQLPLIGHTAIYTLNLIVLAAILSEDGFVFDEEQLGRHEDGAQGWDRLINLWRAWFSLENLEGLTAVLEPTARVEDQVQLKSRDKFAAQSSKNKLESILNVSRVLGDREQTAMAGLLAFDSTALPSEELDSLVRDLSEAELDLDQEVLVKRLRGSMATVLPAREYWSLLRRAEFTLLQTRHNNRDTFNAVLEAANVLGRWVFGSEFEFGERLFRRVYRSERELIGDEKRVAYRERYDETTFNLLARLGSFGHRDLRRVLRPSDLVEAIGRLAERPLSELPLPAVTAIIRAIPALPYSERSQILDMVIASIHHDETCAMPPQIMAELIRSARRSGDRPAYHAIYSGVRPCLMSKAQQSEQSRLHTSPDLINQLITIAVETGDSEFLLQLSTSRVFYSLNSLPDEDANILISQLRQKWHDVELLRLFYDVAISGQPLARSSGNAVWFARHLRGPLAYFMIMLAHHLDDEELLAALWEERVRTRRGYMISDMPLKYLPTFHQLAEKFDDADTLQEIEDVLSRISGK